MTCDWYTPDIIAGDMVYTSPDRDGLAFAVIESRMFMTWQQTIGGRLEITLPFQQHGGLEQPAPARPRR